MLRSGPQLWQNPDSFMDASVALLLIPTSPVVHLHSRPGGSGSWTTDWFMDVLYTCSVDWSWTLHFCTHSWTPNNRKSMWQDDTQPSSPTPHQNTCRLNFSCSRSRTKTQHSKERLAETIVTAKRLYASQRLRLSHRDYMSRFTVWHEGKMLNQALAKQEIH